jgi:hypothetical protein
MELNKILGLILLIIGLLIIFWGFYSAYNVFQGKAGLPKIFTPAETALIEEEIAPTPQTGTLTPEKLQENMEEMMQKQIGKIFPSGIIMQLMNLIAWSIFIWILIYGGGKIAGLGIKLFK